jgi:hypothetical protein
MEMQILNDENRVVLFKVNGAESILSMALEVGNGNEHPFTPRERRSPTALLERKAHHTGTEFVLHEQLESIFKTVYREYLTMYNEEGFSPRNNFLLTRMDIGDWFMLHNDFNTDDPEDDIQGYVAIMYLNKGFEGGKLGFDDLDIIYDPVPGDVMVFPLHVWHNISEVRGKERYTAQLLVEKYKDKSLAATTDLWPEK